MYSRLRVLVVDDDPSIGELLANVLGDDECDVTSTTSPKNGLELTNTRNFHIVVLDLQMPEMTGIEFMAELRKFDLDVAVIILTGFPSLDSAQSAINLDISAYLRKPSSAAEIRETVASVARKKGIVVRREDELHINIGRTIRELRKRQSLTLKQMSRKVGLSISMLSQIERAEVPASLSNLYRVANALEVRMVDLIGDF